MTAAADNLALAAELAKALAAHDRVVAKRAQEIGDKYSIQHAKAAQEQIEAKDAELRRATDLINELRRQLKPAQRYSDRYALVMRAARKAQGDGNGVVRVDVLLDIFAGRWDQATNTDAGRASVTDPPIKERS